MPPDSTVTTESPGFACPSHAADGSALALAVGALVGDPHPTTSTLSDAIKTGVTACDDHRLPPSRLTGRRPATSEK
jgi:hypothetical protein